MNFLFNSTRKEQLIITPSAQVTLLGVSFSFCAPEGKAAEREGRKGEKKKSRRRIPFYSSAEWDTCVIGVGADLDTANTQKDMETGYLDDQFVVLS